jgi:hypothetical protein
MNKRVVIVTATIGVVVGLTIGVIGASWFWTKFNAEFTNSGFILRTQSDIVTKVAVLSALRAGHNEDGIKLLETLLDGDLIGAGALARDGAKFSSNARRAVEVEYRAREASGYEPTDPTVRTAVQEAFRLVPLAVDAK